jgi:hypothetical protein
VGSAQDIIGVAAELFTWIGFGGAALCFISLLVVRASLGKPVSSEGVLAETEDGPQLRWLADDGVLRSRKLTASETADATDPDNLFVYFRRRTPDRVELQRVDHAERVLRLLGFILVGVGVVATVVSVIAMLTE